MTDDFRKFTAEVKNAKKAGSASNLQHFVMNASVEIGQRVRELAREIRERPAARVKVEPTD